MTDTQRLKVILASTFLLRFAFLGVPMGEVIETACGVKFQTYDPFLLSSLRFTTVELCFHLFESLWDVAFAFVVMKEITRYKFMPAFFYFFLGRLIEYILTGNDIWFMWGWFPVSWNTVGGIMVFLALIWCNGDE